MVRVMTFLSGIRAILNFKPQIYMQNSFRIILGSLAGFTNKPRLWNLYDTLDNVF